MTPERWHQIETIFHAAADRPPADRAGFLDRACGDDAELRGEVDSLLAQNVVDSVLQAPILNAAESVTREAEDARVGQRLGFYKLTGVIGQGGMGTVYLGVRDDDQYRKQVAIKLVKRGMDTDSLLRRFRHERQILASLEHPHVARLLDGGTTDDGLPYLVMERVDGQPVTAYCDASGLTIPERLGLFLKVCAAVSYAHQNLVVHRDLKPTNILVTKEGTPKLLDFGIAKLLTADPDSPDTPQTATSLHLMTPDYASPEQVRGLPITTAVDVYSLGAVLYEILSGERAHQFKSYSPSEIERVVCDTDAEKPSAAAGRTRTPTARLRKHLAGDLDNIVLMAMRKESGRRYPSVEQFAEDVRRYLAGRPVMARQDTVGYRAGKFVRRHRIAVASAAVIAITLIGGLAMTLYQARRAERRFDQVRRLANTVLFDLSDQIGALPGSTQARETVARTGLEYLDSLAAEAAGDPELQLEVAEGYHRLGLVQAGFRAPGLQQFDAALASHRKALALGRELMARMRDTRVLCLMVKSHSYIGDILQERGQLREAALEMQEGMRFVDALEAQPDLTMGQMLDVVVLLHFDGDLQLKLGSRRVAEQQYRRALQWDERVLARFPGPGAQHSLSLDLATFGDALAAGGDLRGAMEQYYKALAIRLENVKQNPDNARYRRELSLLYSWMGHFTGNPLRMNLGDRAKAEEYYRLGLAIAEPLAVEDSKNVQAQVDLSFALEHLASVVVLRDPRAAVELYRRALTLLGPLLEKSPDELRYLRRRATQQRLLAVALHRRGDRGAAVDEMRDALSRVRALVAAQPANETIKADLYATLMASARVAFDTGVREESSRQLQEAQTVAEALSKARPDDLDWQWRLADVYLALGGTVSAPQACDWRRKALTLWEAWPSHAVSSPFDTTRRDQAARAVAECTSRPN